MKTGALTEYFTPAGIFRHHVNYFIRLHYLNHRQKSLVPHTIIQILWPARNEMGNLYLREPGCALKTF